MPAPVFLQGHCLEQACVEAAAAQYIAETSGFEVLNWAQMAGSEEVEGTEPNVGARRRGENTVHVSVSQCVSQ